MKGQIIASEAVEFFCDVDMAVHERRNLLIELDGSPRITLDMARRFTISALRDYANYLEAIEIEATP